MKATIAAGLAEIKKSVIVFLPDTNGHNKIT
jgi:hypothetical protein